MNAREIHTLDIFSMNCELQNKWWALIEVYCELVHLDSLLIPLESSSFHEDDEIVDTTMGMIPKDISWQNEHFGLALQQ